MTDPTFRSGTREGLRSHGWNLLLLLPLLMLVSPWFNSVEPRLLGIPFFYWSQLVWVPISVICMVLVHVNTRDRAPR